MSKSRVLHGLGTVAGVSGVLVPMLDGLPAGTDPKVAGACQLIGVILALVSNLWKIFAKRSEPPKP